MNRNIQTGLTITAVSTIAALGFIFIGCSHNESVAEAPASKVYSTLEDLDIEYNDTRMVGKSAAYTQDATNPNAGSITFNSTFDIASYLPQFKGVPALPAPGVLPGSPSLTIPVKLKPDGNEFSFSGSGETPFVTYNYDGDINGSKLDFEFENVKLKNTVLANTGWRLAPIQKSGLTYTSLPLHLVWECELPGQQLTSAEIQTGMTLLATLPIIPVYQGTAYMSIAQAIGSSIQSIGFAADGNLVITYLQRNTGAAQFITAPQCMLQYAPVSSNQLLLFANPVDLISQVLVNVSSHPELPPHPFTKPSRGDASTTLSPIVQQILPAVIENLAPLMAKGIPLEFNKATNSMQLYMNQDLLMPIIQKVVTPILQSPEIQGMILQKIAQDPLLSAQLPKITKLLELMPQIIEATNRIEIGINLVN